jgi:hypothetical protein
MTPRRFRPPWTVLSIRNRVQDAGGQTVGCFISANSEETARQAKMLTRDGAWRRHGRGAGGGGAQMGGHVSVSSRVGAGTTGASRSSGRHRIVPICSLPEAMNLPASPQPALKPGC